MVPDIPSRRRMSKVEILQHVIDFIQDLESALELPHLHVHLDEQLRKGFKLITIQQDCVI